MRSVVRFSRCSARCLDVPDNPPESPVPLGTQTVTGLTIDLMHRTFECVTQTEKRSPLKVCLTSSGDLVAHRKLCIFDGDQTFPVYVSTITMEGDNDAYILFNAKTHARI